MSIQQKVFRLGNLQQIGIKPERQWMFVLQQLVSTFL